MPLVSVKQEPIDDEHEKLPVPDKNLPVPDNVNPESAVVYGPHQLEPPASLFTKLNLFNIMDEHRRSTSLTNRLSIPLNIPQNTKLTQDQVLSLPSPQTTQAKNPEHQNPENPLPIQSENSHTDETRSEPQSKPNPETTPTIPIDDSLLDFEFETGNPPELQVAEPTDEEDNLPLSQVKKNQANANGKKKIQEEHVDKNPVAKIQVFPSPVTRRKTRSSTTQQEKETPTPARKTKRKQPIAEQPVPVETTTSKKRKKSTTQTQQPESQPDVSAVTPLEVITPQFLSDEYAARWDSTNKRKILSERYLDVEKFKSQCQLMPVFEKLNLVKSVTTQTSYPPIAIKEFYANLLKTIKEAGSHVYGRVWLRDNEYNFDTRTINLYLGIDASDIEDPIIGANTITKVITGGTYSYWPAETNMLPAKSLTTKYAILHKLAMTNWMPNEHR
ncbi:proteoglycan 4-like [Ipomoea triloba]|uniref:proteoglycan 4-like n=1 Tax=Ipomoea triloba TaxID=35885 RepID=UPI00125D3737|nr:proteoglycan 4-like [Ipomoea triloba]